MRWIACLLVIFLVVSFFGLTAVIATEGGDGASDMPVTKPAYGTETIVWDEPPADVYVSSETSHFWGGN